MDKTTHTIGLLEGIVLFQLAAILAKYFGLTDISWFWILSPTWITISIVSIGIVLFWKLSKEILQRIINWWKNRKGNA
jgi:DNA integrity scanning protein DisA with diadenylate cyclase activity